MNRSPDVIVIGRGPAGLLFSSLVLEQGGRVTMVADSQGSLPLWGGQLDFRNYDDDQQAVEDPWDWWQRAPGAHVGAALQDNLWRTWWQHLHDLWDRIGIPIEGGLPDKNRRVITPLGHLKSTFLAPAWHFTQDHAGPITLVGVPDLVDFPATTIAQIYERTTGQSATVVELERTPSWRMGWNSLNWAWYLDSEDGKQWLLAQARRITRNSATPLVFPQMLGVDTTESLIADLSQVWEGVVGEIPLPPPSVGGIRIQRRWERWLRRQGTRLFQGHVTTATKDYVVLGNGQNLQGGHVVLATGGVLGGGIEVTVDGVVCDPLMKVRLGSVKTSKDLAILGYKPRSSPLPVVGSAVEGCDPNRHGDSGAMMLLTSRDALWEVTRQGGRVAHAGGV